MQFDDRDFQERLGIVQRYALIAGLLGVAGCAVGFFLTTHRFYWSYLTAYQFVLGAALGSLFIIMLQYLTGGVWGVVLRRISEASAITLPLMAVLFVPLIFGMHYLYEWTHDDQVADDPLLQHKRPYLNVPSFLVRSVVYFVLWSSFAILLVRSSLKQDRAPSQALALRLRRLSAAGLITYGLTATFASIDWIMSLQPHWFSAMFGVLFVVENILTALALGILLLMWMHTRSLLVDILHRSLMRDLGNLLMAFVMVWAYLAFAQYLLMWSANLPEEIAYYIRRLHGGWQWLALTLVVFHFALPFVLLLSRDVKENRRALAGVAGGVLAMRFVDLYWQILPAMSPTTSLFHWLDLATLLGVGGLWTAAMLWHLRRHPLLPLRDPVLLGALGHERE